MFAHTLSGKVTNGDGKPLKDIQLRLISDVETLGTTPYASVIMRSAVEWTRKVSGFSGDCRSAYRKFIADRVGGISFAEFKDKVIEKNPALQKTNFLFQSNQSYVLPENLPNTVSISWERTLQGFTGNRWQCWQRLLANKIVGMSWIEFREAVVTHNSSLAKEGYRFHSDQTYTLPLNPHLTEFEVAAITSTQGNYRFKQLPSGRYRLEVAKNGVVKFINILEVVGDLTYPIMLNPPSLVQPAAMQTSPAFIQVQGSKFAVNGAPLPRFIGVNIRGVLHYGESYQDENNHTQKVIQHSQTSHRKQSLLEAHELGATVVRFFLPHYSCTKEELVVRMHTLLKVLNEVNAERQSNLYLLPALINLYHNNGFFPFPIHEMDDKENGFFAQQGQYRRLLPKFFVQPYCQPYLEMVDHIVREFRQEHRILAWEIGNELKLDPGHTSGIGAKEFVQFNHMIAERIKSIDSNHLVTTGLKSTQHPHMLSHRDLAEKLYDGRRSNGQRLIDFMTIHSYFDPEELDDEKKGFEVDAKLAQAIRMPFIIEETGVKENAGDFSTKLEEHMRLWFSERGTYGMMYWGFHLEGLADGNRGNHDLGDPNVRQQARIVHQRFKSVLAV